MKKFLTVIMVMLPGAALAHTGQGHVDGFMHGLEHPVFGLDHLLAMLAVGLWSGFALPHKVWAGAAAFMTAMIIGALLAWSGVILPGIEALILFSVFVFGALLLVAKPGQNQAMIGASLAAIGFFAMSHGYAHAAETSGGALGYAFGFLISTGLLHLLGIGIAKSVSRWPRAPLVAGLGILGMGTTLLIGG